MSSRVWKLLEKEKGAFFAPDVTSGEETISRSPSAQHNFMGNNVFFKVFFM